jgi:3-deoxy-D-manno-octulosonate 8-phosphate phosphatase KdsC-like HAD superfamily phosphatase
MDTTLNLADGAHTVTAQAVDAAGNVSAFSTAINFTVDTKAPLVNLVESVSSIPGITSTPPSGQYFRVQFSENVIQVNPNDFRVLNADGSVNPTATIASVYRGTSGSTADTYTPEDDYYVVVNSAGQTNLSVGVVPVVNISATTPYTGTTPTGASLLSTGTAATQADLTGGTWVKIDLNNPVATLPTSTGWLTTTSSQAGITAPYVVATAPGSTTLSFYAYVKSTTPGTALDVSKLNFTLQSNDAGANTGSQAFGASITDIAGNSLLSDPMLDDLFVINASTPTLASNATFIIRPATGVGGFDTLDLSALSSAKPIDVVAEQGQIIVQGASAADTKVYRIENFDEFIISNASGVNFRGTMAASEVVQLTAPVSSNDIRLANRPQTDLSPETDIVDYSKTSNAVTVNLGTTIDGGNGWFYATATKGALGVGGEDKIAGAEGIFGSSASDTITGGLRDNLLAGGAGNDRLDGAAGNDILDGGAGTGDILIGGAGKDILIDLDGATLTGNTAKKNQSVSGDQDVFVVRTGSTIENFHVARDGAGLAGRAAASANDTILFNLSVGILSEKLAGYNAAVAGKSTSQLQVELAKIKKDIDIRVEKTTIDGDNTSDDWAVIASYNGGLHAAPVELARVIVKDMNTTVMPASSVLTDVALPDFSLKNAVSDDIDQLVFSQVSDLLVDNQAINLAVALESVRQGTVREVKAGGLMFGDFSLTERIFNPGVGSEKIFGSNKKDTYEFLVQDLKSSNGNSTPDAGVDQILDTGGDDAVAFSNITRSQLNQLDFNAVKLGLETGHYSLSSNYSQSAGDITNQGGFTWTGHFRDGFDMELEQISLGDATLAMADVRYRYDAEGNILNWTPNQVAISGKDTIMVGGVGRSADASTFVVEKGATFDTDIGGDKTQHLYIWDADANAVSGDVIDLKAFFGTKALAQAAVQNSVETNSFATNIKDSSSFKIDLDANNDLILNFMDINLTQESLEMMIARAYAA